MLTLIFGIQASEPPRAWRTTEKAGPDRVKDSNFFYFLDVFVVWIVFFFKIMQGITNLTQDIQRTWVGIQRTQITRMCSFWLFS